MSYGLLRCLMNDGSEFPLGTFPPEYGHFGWQSAIFHSGLRFFEMELADSLFLSPADWSLCRRMMRAGVRFGMADEVVTDHYESLQPRRKAGNDLTVAVSRVSVGSTEPDLRDPRTVETRETPARPHRNGAVTCTASPRRSRMRCCS